MRTLHLWRIFLLVMIIIVTANILFLDYIWLSERKTYSDAVVKLNTVVDLINDGSSALLNQSSQAMEATSTTKLQSPVIRNDSDCGPLCQRIIEQKVAQAINVAKVLPVSPDPVTQTTNTTTTNIVIQAGTYYIPLGGTGSTKNTSWTEIPTTETVIDWSEYGNKYTITWDAYGKVYQGNGKAKFRIYDKTNNIAVPNSEIETGSETSAHMISSNLQVWSGKNTYVVQTKSLTGYESFFESGRIKVVVK